MLKNFLTVAWRNLLRQKGYTLLNILGLTLGLSASLLIVLYLHQQLSFDRQHLRGDRIYRISSDIQETDAAFRWSISQLPLGPELKAQFPEVEHAVRFIPQDRVQITVGEQEFFDENLFATDSNVFEVFTFPLTKGDPATALAEPNSIVLDEELAARVLGRGGDTLGAVITLNDRQEVKLTGIMEKVPETSHIVPHGLLSTADMEVDPRQWGGFNIYTYVLLAEGTDPKAFEEGLARIIDLHVRPIFDQFGVEIGYETIALRDIHLRSDYLFEPEPVGSMDYIYIFSAIGLFLLLIACINYMNLATARSARRAREVGIRKVLGSWRIHLIGQFMAESVLVALLSLLVSLGVVYVSLSFFNQMLDLPLSFSGLFEGNVLLGMIGMLILTGVFAGSYPALYLSGFSPVHVLKGASGKTTGGGRRLRQGLVVLQFGISLFMLASTGIVFDQLQYLGEKSLGFTQDPVIRFQFSNREQMEAWPELRTRLLGTPGVEAAATTGSAPGQDYGKNLMPIETNDGQMVERGLDLFTVDFDYFSTMEMRIPVGRDFDRSLSTDSTEAVLVNEAMVRRMAWDDPIGKRIQMGIGQEGEEEPPYVRVIGVVGDYHHKSLYHEIEPLLFIHRENNRNGMVRIQAQNVEQTLAAIEAAWQETYPTTPFEYSFLDEAFMAQYEADKHRSELFTLFSGLTILIACLGLLGLAAYSAEQRTREVGIRKIVGASVPNLIQLLTKEFLILLLIATPLAFGAAWYFMRGWLEGFAYHAPIQVLTFVMALMVTLFITLATTSYHAWRAATRNPAEALRYE
ncbi:MAG: ABC transporter permease [Bacteroidetes bacterium]|nr:MAG: ABC transporter permease [Bacteroidota bacterium]